MKTVKFFLFIVLSLFSFSKAIAGVPPHIQLIEVPAAETVYKKGERAYVKWSSTDADSITTQSVSLYKDGSLVKVLRESPFAGPISCNWLVDAPGGSGYQFYFFAVDTTGDYSAKESEVFSIASDPVFTITGHLLGDPDSNGSMTPVAGFGVNSVSGNFFYEETDVSMPGIELPFAFTRSYNSHDIPFDSFGNPLDIPLGLSWTHSYNIFLRFNGDSDQAEIFWGDGRRDLFQKSGGNWAAASPANFNKLAAGSSENTWEIITSDQTRFAFNSNLQLAEIKARTGQSIRLEYQNNKLSRIVDTAGRSITFSYINGRLTRIDVPPSRNIQFEYTEDNYLLRNVIDMRGNAHRFNYSKGYLHEIHRANVDSGGTEKAELQITYESTPPYKVIKQHTGHSLSVDNPGYLFDWDTPNKLYYNTPTAQGAWFEWNSNGQVINITPVNYPGGGDEVISYAAPAGPSSALTTTFKNLENQTTSFTYDPDSPHNPSQITLPDNKKYLFDFDGSNDLLSSTSPEGLNVQYINNTWGKPESISITGSGIPSTINTTATYNGSGDFAGQVKSVTDAGNGETQIVSRTSDGQPLEIREYVTDSTYLKTNYNYDGASRLISTVDHRGTYSCLYYDANDNLTDTVLGLTTSCNQSAPASITVRHTRYTYDDDDRVISITEGWGSSVARTVTYTYNNDTGQLTQVADHGGARAVSMIYDDDGRLFKMLSSETGREDRFYKLENGHLNISYSNANNSQNTGSRIERIKTDGNGNLTHISSCDTIAQPDVSSSDCMDDDVRAQFSYDDRQRLIGTNLSLELNGGTPTLKRTTNLTYSDDGRIVTSNTILLNTTGEIKKEVETDSAGRLIRVTEFDDTVGHTTSAQYDGVGRVTLVTDASNLQTSYEYDRLGRPTQQTDLRGTVRWSYDDANGKVTQTEPDNSTIVSTHDRLGQLIQVNTSDGNIFSFTYDARGRLTKEIWTGTGGTGERNYTYTVFNELATVTDSFGQTVTYTYDNAGRMEQRSYAGINLNYTYNAFDMITDITSPAGNFQFSYQPYTMALASIAYPNGVNSTYQRNPLGELETLTSNHAGLGDFLNYSLTLDTAGRAMQIDPTQPTEAQYPAQDYQFAFDQSGLVATLNNSKINYDARGNITALPSPVATSFSYDALNRMTQHDTSQYLYDSGRNRIATTRDGVTQRYLWDKEPGLPDVAATLDDTNKVDEVFIYGPGGLLAGSKGGTWRFVHQDFNHNITALTDNAGTVVGSYAYTPYGVSAGQQGIADFPFGFAGGVGGMDDHDGLIYMRARYYHPGIRRFTSGDLVPGLLDRPMSLGRYGYVEGQALGAVDPTGMMSWKQFSAGAFLFAGGAVATVGAVAAVATAPATVPAGIIIGAAFYAGVPTAGIGLVYMAGSPDIEPGSKSEKANIDAATFATSASCGFGFCAAVLSGLSLTPYGDTHEKMIRNANIINAVNSTTGFIRASSRAEMFVDVYNAVDSVLGAREAQENIDGKKNSTLNVTPPQPAKRVKRQSTIRERVSALKKRGRDMKRNRIRNTFHNN